MIAGDAHVSVSTSFPSRSLCFLSICSQYLLARSQRVPGSTAEEAHPGNGKLLALPPKTRRFLLSRSSCSSRLRADGYQRSEIVCQQEGVCFIASLTHAHARMGT